MLLYKNTGYSPSLDSLLITNNKHGAHTLHLNDIYGSFGDLSCQAFTAAVTQQRSEMYLFRCFGVMHCLHLQGIRN
jgi:hypothetical protein